MVRRWWIIRTRAPRRWSCPTTTSISEWSGDAQLWWVEGRPGGRLTLRLEVPEASTYELVGFFTQAGDYGIVRVLVNGEPVGSLMNG